MRFVAETYCTYTYPCFFDSEESLASIIEKIRKTGEQHPLAHSSMELNDIHEYSEDPQSSVHPTDDAQDPIDIRELTSLVGRTLRIVHAIPWLE